MKKKAISLLTLTLSAAMMTSNCGLRQAEKPDQGLIEGSTYSNKFFGMSLTIPEKWLAHSADDTDPFRKQGTELIAGENKGMKDKIEAGEQNVVQLISVSHYPLNYTGGFNASFQCTAEKLGVLSGVSNSSDYIANFRKIMSQAQGQLKYTLGDTTYSESIGGMSFLALYAHAKLGQLTLEQKLCVSVIKGYALVFIVTYASEDDLAILDGVLKSVSFSGKQRM
jgi:hypothetical protein